MEVFCSTEGCNNQPHNHAGLCRECLLRLKEEREIAEEQDDVPIYAKGQVLSFTNCENCKYVGKARRLSEFPFDCPRCGEEIEALF